MSKILYLSFVDWFWIKQRPHHIPEILAKDNLVTYLCVKPWKKNTNIVCSHGDENEDDSNKSRIKKGNLNIERVRVLPFQYTLDFIKRLNSVILKLKVRTLVNGKGYEKIIITHPDQVRYLSDDIINKTKIVYDCMDNYSKFLGADKDIEKNERYIVGVANNIVVSSEDLKNKLIEKYKEEVKQKITIINNAVDTDIFKPMNEKKINKRIGYVGTVSDWFDIDLIKKSAIENPDCEFYIVGPNEIEEKTNKLECYANIKFAGSKPYYQIPDIVASFDVCLMPFQLNDVVESVNPVKIYEYLAMGKPVISIKYKETLKFEEYIYLYNNYEEFSFALTKALSETGDRIDDRVKFAKNNNWQKRAEEFIKIL